MACGRQDKKEKEREENEDVEAREDDFENIVDEVSDGEGDEQAFQQFAVEKVRCLLSHRLV